MHQIKGVVIDFFGVLHSDPYHSWLSHLGVKNIEAFENLSRLVDRGDISEAEFYRRLAQVSDQSLASIQDSFRKNAILNTEILELVRKLSKRYKLGLLSNSSSEYLRPILLRHDLIKLFDEIIISAEVGLIKPEPAIFQLMLRKLRLSPKACLFIDDNAQNVNAAKQLGMSSVLHSSSVDELKQALLKLGLKY